MAKLWQPQDRKVYGEWVSAILAEASDRLSDWENSFMSSIDDLLTRGRDLTQAQAEKLESIYTKYTS